MIEKLNLSGLPATPKKYTSPFKAECVRQVAAGARQSDMGRYALRSWLHRKGLWGLSTRPQRTRTTVANPAAVVAENRLLGRPVPTAPDQV